MKKIITTIVLAAMLLATFVVTASAETYLVNDPCQVNFEIKKADPAYVVKDGIISEGEYEKVTFNKDDLAITFLGSGCWASADAMADTIEYYFSWDEVHGLNFAVRYDAYPVAAGVAAGYTEDQIKDGFTELYRHMKDIPIPDMDGVIDTVCTLCWEYEKAGFVEGIKAVIRLF